ncbi:MAG: cysteine desulfurase family protein [Rhizomicrobium sp.]
MAMVYFDNAATTPIDPRVRDAMQPFLAGVYGNPSSLHAIGREARAALDHARAQLAALIHADPNEIIFTASGTEADNLALTGFAKTLPMGEHHIIASAIEHPAVLATLRNLASTGIAVTLLPVTPDGLVDPAALRAALRPETRLVSVMAANNVLGTIQPIHELAEITHDAGALFHSDAVQAVGKIPFDLSDGTIDLLSISAHKLYGPKGVGALYVRGGVTLRPFIFGGGQEYGMRSATENVAGIVGLGKAAEIASAEMANDAARIVALRDQLIDGVQKHIGNAYLIGHRYRRLPGHIALGFSGQEGEAIKLLLALDEAGFAVSTGSACSASHAAEPSYILTALGFDAFRARGALRITLGRFNTEAEIERFIDVLIYAVAGLRSITSIRA